MLIEGKIFYDLDLLQQNIAEVLRQHGVELGYTKYCKEDNSSNYDMIEEALVEFGVVLSPKDKKLDDGFENLFELRTNFQNYIVTVSGIIHVLSDRLIKKFDIHLNNDVARISEYDFEYSIVNAFNKTPHAMMVDLNCEEIVIDDVEKAAKISAKKFHNQIRKALQEPTIPLREVMKKLDLEAESEEGDN